MGAIAEIVRRYGDEYLERFGERMPADQRRVLAAIRSCRTAEAGFHLYRCEDCGEEHVLFRGCGNRHCPNCQQAKTQQWLQRRLREQLPGHHFFVTFTVPEPLRRFLRSHQQVGYEALFAASSSALKALIAEPKWVGGDLPGFWGVLHTWGRTLEYHPHIHYVVAGGAIDRKTGLWKSAREDFLVPIKALSELMRGRFKAAMQKAKLFDRIDPRVWQQDWVVDSQAVGSSVKGPISYLAPYIFRVAISDSRIVNVEDRQVTFRYRRSDNGKQRQMTLDAMEFLRRFLQHVLPSGFMKIRYYGFLGSGCRLTREEIALQIQLANHFDLPEPIRPDAVPPREATCPHCGGHLRLRLTIWPSRPIYLTASGFT